MVCGLSKKDEGEFCWGRKTVYSWRMGLGRQACSLWCPLASVHHIPASLFAVCMHVCSPAVATQALQWHTKRLRSQRYMHSLRTGALSQFVTPVASSCWLLLVVLVPWQQHAQCTSCSALLQLQPELWCQEVAVIYALLHATKNIHVVAALYMYTCCRSVIHVAALYIYSCCRSVIHVAALYTKYMAALLI
jgi:hypothetical protein